MGSFFKQEKCHVRMIWRGKKRVERERERESVCVCCIKIVGQLSCFFFGKSAVIRGRARTGG